ncbi:MAG TPA: hypothetical protein VMR46_00455 [Candidatus Paceibacterota bacterium]|nr:hypothetical protein [Candidatus Paceibacterota bacterium]
MRRASIYITTALLFVCVLAVAQNPAHADGTASIAGLYPAPEVPIGATVTFSIITSGFTNPTYYLVDSFPGGATSGNVDSSGNFSWTPNIDDVGTHGLTITASDAAGDSATVSQQIVVDGAASISIQSLLPSASVNIGNPVTFSVSPSGLLNPTYTVGDSFFNSSLQSYALNAAGNFTWTPIAQDIGTHTIAVTAKDPYGNIASTSAVITVLPISSVSFTNFAPSMSVNAGSALSFTATSTGFASPTYTVKDAFYSTGTSTMTIDPASGKASWVPVYNDLGVHLISLVASDSTGRSATTTVSITVLPPLPTPITQTVTPAATTPTTQAVAPSAATKAPTTPAQTPASVSANNTRQSSPTPQNTAAFNVPPTTQPLSFTATTSTNGTVATMPTTAPEPQVVIPPNAPTESMAGFFLHSVINFFTSIVKLL